MTKDVRVEVKIRNNLVLTKMEEKGISSVAELCRLMNLPTYQTRMGSLISMKVSARDKNDDWIPLAIKLADFFQCMPDDLFSEPQQRERLERNRAYAEVAFTELQMITSRSREPATPEIALQAQNLRTAIGKVLQSLTPREEQVLRLRFGFEEEELTFAEIGKMLERSSERIREIEAKALRKLKHPSRINIIIDAGGDKKMFKRKRSWDDSEYLATEYTIDDEVLKAV